MSTCSPCPNGTAPAPPCGDFDIERQHAPLTAAITCSGCSGDQNGGGPPPPPSLVSSSWPPSPWTRRNRAPIVTGIGGLVSHAPLSSTSTLQMAAVPMNSRGACRSLQRRLLLSLAWAVHGGFSSNSSRFVTAVSSYVRGAGISSSSRVFAYRNTHPGSSLSHLSLTPSFFFGPFSPLCSSLLSSYPSPLTRLIYWKR